MTPFIVRATVLLLALLAFSACSWFRDNPSNYQNAHETRPLEVPPGLDVPPRTAEMTVPEAHGGHAAPPEAAGGHAPPPAAAMPPSGSSNSTAGAQKPAYIGTETSLALEDDVASAYRRVGIALERSGTVNVTARDEVAATFTVTRQEVTQEGGWFRRLTGTDTSKSTTITRVVRVVPDGKGARVQVEDEAGRETTDDNARLIIAALRERLG